MGEVLGLTMFDDSGREDFGLRVGGEPRCDKG
jgi:hypothetical protein